jgi:preprotein translocase subunit SecG
LAGEDLGGMVNIIHSSLVTTRLSWGNNFVAKYDKLSILAVGVNGIQDKLDITLPRHFGQGCQGEGVTGKQLGENMNMNNLSLVTWVSFVVLFISILLFISLILSRKSNHVSASSSTENLVCEM